MNDTLTVAEATEQAGLEAAKALADARESLDRATVTASSERSRMVALILETRPSGLLSVDRIAEAINRNRNYVDSLWSDHKIRHHGGEATQTRVEPSGSTAAAKARFAELHQASERVRASEGDVLFFRDARNRAIVQAYESGSLGPVKIAEYSGIDRNHVGRVLRKAGVNPRYRTNTRNQHMKTGKRSAE